MEHWVHLRCAGIRQAQYTDTWTCHLHRESRLTPHTDITPPHRSRPLSKPPTHSPPTPPTPPQPKHRHMSNTPPVPRGLVKPKPNYLIHPHRPEPNTHTPPAPLTSTSPVLDKTPEPRLPLIHALTATTPSPGPHTSTAVTLAPSHSHSTHTCNTNNSTCITVTATTARTTYGTTTTSQTPNDYHRTTNTTQTRRPSSKSERNLIIPQVNINGLRNKLEELKLLIHDTDADIITIQETKLTPKAKTPNIHNFTSVRTDGLHKAGGGPITLIRYNITFTTTDIPSTINTHNIELQMVKVHINNTKHITIANIYIPPRDTTSTHYRTADTDIQHCIQYITNIPHSVLTGDVNAHSTLWHSYTDDHRGQLIAYVISNSDHITLNTNTPTRVRNTTLQQTSSPDITTVSNTLYNRTSGTTQHALSSDHLPIITTINIRHDYGLQQNRLTYTNYKKADWTQFTEDTESAFAQTTIPTNIHTANIIFTNIILMADKQNIPKGKMHSNCRLLPEDIVCKITQRNNIRRANTCDPALKLLNEEITSDIQ